MCVYELVELRRPCACRTRMCLCACVFLYEFKNLVGFAYAHTQVTYAVTAQTCARFDLRVHRRVRWQALEMGRSHAHAHSCGLI
jgi:hypothetical protein